MLIHDLAAPTTRARTAEGFLQVRARVARTGVHLYRASELGAPPGFGPNDAIRVYRPPEEVFAPEAMASFAVKPVTAGHPPAMVDARNWKHYAVGHSGPAVTRDGDHLVTDLLITDADAVVTAEAGAQLSNGYLADFDFAPGETPEGESYDAVQRNIRGNHIALVDAGRCGESCRIGDEAVADCGCGTDAPTMVTIDGIAIETTAAGAANLQRLRLAVEAKDGAIAALKAKILDERWVDTLVADRATVLDAARGVFGPGYVLQGKTSGELRRAVVAQLLGSAAADRSDAYVAAAFDTLIATQSAPNALAAHLGSAVSRGTRDAARQNRDRYLNQAWKGDQPHGVR